MAENKTKPTKQSVADFLNKVEPEQKRRDAFEILDMMKKITGENPVMWGPSIIGFGHYHYTYDSGREGDMGIAGFSPRKAAMTIYIMGGFDRYKSLMKKLGKYKSSISCLYIKRLSDVNRTILAELISESVQYMRSKK